MLIQRAVNEDKSHRLAGVTAFRRCKVTRRSQLSKHAWADRWLHTPRYVWLVFLFVYLQDTVPMTGDSAVNVQHIIFGIHPPYLWDRNVKTKQIEQD